MSAAFGRVLKPYSSLSISEHRLTYSFRQSSLRIIIMLSKGAGYLICRIEGTEATSTSLEGILLICLLRQCPAVFRKEESLGFEFLRVRLLAMSGSKIGTTD